MCRTTPGVRENMFQPRLLQGLIWRKPCATKQKCVLLFFYIQDLPGRRFHLQLWCSTGGRFGSAAWLASPEAR
jgi:hypothetical protein